MQKQESDKELLFKKHNKIIRTKRMIFCNLELNKELSKNYQLKLKRLLEIQ